MDEEYLKAKSKYSTSHMNNSKWLKLFTAWAESGVEIESSKWKYLDSNHEEEHCLPKRSDLLHTRFADGRFQPIEYKWILSISIPRTYRPVSNVGYERTQDIEKLVSVAEELGKFPIIATNNGIEVIAYEK